MDRLEKAIEIVEEMLNECSELNKCIHCRFKKKCDKYLESLQPYELIGVLENFNSEIPKEQSIVLKNIDLNKATLDELFDEVIEKNEECKYALTNLIELIKCNVNKEYLKEHYIDKILDQLQANINIASIYGITTDDIMKYYNTKYLEKLKK